MRRRILRLFGFALSVLCGAASAAHAQEDRPLAPLIAEVPIIPRGDTVPPAILMVPIVLRDRLVAVLYADNGTGPLGPVDPAAWKRLSQMAAMSLEILILRNKMRRV